MAKISVIVPIYALDEEIISYAVKCLDSIGDHEIIVVDNGGAEEVLKRSKAKVSITMSLNDNVGYGMAINMGMSVATGDILVALNDDVILPVGWERFTDILVDPMVGVVRPGELSEQPGGLVEDHAWYHGFCWAITRATYERLSTKKNGLMDPRFGLGYFEDLDLWHRMRKRHLKMMKDFRVKVFHYGGLTIHKMDHSELQKINEQKFIEKHNLPNWKEIYYPWE
jgi:glycosyltransferase involved in cell wall biosynthesis